MSGTDRQSVETQAVVWIIRTLVKVLLSVSLVAYGTFVMKWCLLKAGWIIPYTGLLWLIATFVVFRLMWFIVNSVLKADLSKKEKPNVEARPAGVLRPVHGNTQYPRSDA